MSLEESFNFFDIGERRNNYERCFVIIAFCACSFSQISKSSQLVLFIPVSTKYVFSCPGHALTLKKPATFSKFYDSRESMIYYTRQANGHTILYVLTCKNKLKLKLFFPMRSGSQKLYPFFCSIRAQTM